MSTKSIYWPKYMNFSYKSLIFTTIFIEGFLVLKSFAITSTSPQLTRTGLQNKLLRCSLWDQSCQICDYVFVFLKDQTESFAWYTEIIQNNIHAWVQFFLSDLLGDPFFLFTISSSRVTHALCYFSTPNVVFKTYIYIKT